MMQLKDLVNTELKNGSVKFVGGDRFDSCRITNTIHSTSKIQKWHVYAGQATCILMAPSEGSGGGSAGLEWFRNNIRQCELLTKNVPDSVAHLVCYSTGPFPWYIAEHSDFCLIDAFRDGSFAIADFLDLLRKLQSVHGQGFVVGPLLARTVLIGGDWKFSEPESGSDLDVRTDIIQMGAVLYRVLVGERAFDRIYHSDFSELIDTLGEDGPDYSVVPFVWKPVVRKALEMNRLNAYRSAGEFAKAVDDAMHQRRDPDGGGTEVEPPLVPCNVFALVEDDDRFIMRFGDQKVPKGTTYCIYRRIDSPPVVTAGLKPLVEIPATSTEYIDRTIDPGRQYFYSVFARRDGVLSRGFVGIGPIVLTPNASGISVKKIRGGFRITFNAPRNASRVRVWRAEDSQGSMVAELDLNGKEAYDDFICGKGGYNYTFVTEYSVAGKVASSSPKVVHAVVKKPPVLATVQIHSDAKDGTCRAASDSKGQGTWDKRKAVDCIGIDFGTSCSSLAYIGEDGNPVIEKNYEQEDATPSVILFTEENIIVGSPAKEIAALCLPEYPPDRVITDAKSQIGSEHTFEMDGESYNPSILSAIILKKMINDFNDNHKSYPKRALIACPSWYGQKERNAVKAAGSIAGLEDVDVIDEPVAIAISHGFGNPGDGLKNIMVCDFGGGSLDITMLQVDGSSFTVVAEHEEKHLGGKDWDVAVSQIILDKVAESTSVSASVLGKDEAIRHLLAFESEVIKKGLSLTDTTKDAIEILGRKVGFTVSREEFEAATADLMQDAIRSIGDVLASKGFTMEDIDQLILVGGSSRMPQVRNALVSRFPYANIRWSDPELSVAKGAVMYAVSDRDYRITAACSDDGTAAQKVSEPEDPDVLFDQGFSSCFGRGAPQSYEAAAESYAKAAALGHGSAQFCLGWMYCRGTGVPCSKEKAAELFKTAAEGGHAGAKDALEMIEKGESMLDS